MPRTARQFSQTGYLHLIVRGIGRQILFEDRQDHLFFLSILEKYSTETSIAILAYCLMDNHAHLLAHDPECSVSLMMKKIGVSYRVFRPAVPVRAGGQNPHLRAWPGDL